MTDTTPDWAEARRLAEETTKHVMTTQPITQESLTRAIADSVAERGAGWTYPDHDDLDWRLPESKSCRYFLADGSPACLFGMALSKLGYGPLDLPEGGSIADILVRIEPYLKSDLTRASEMAQAEQDNGGSWGKSQQVFLDRLEPDWNL